MISNYAGAASRKSASAILNGIRAVLWGMTLEVVTDFTFHARAVSLRVSRLADADVVDAFAVGHGRLAIPMKRAKMAVKPSFGARVEIGTRMETRKTNTHAAMTVAFRHSITAVFVHEAFPLTNLPSTTDSAEGREREGYDR